MEPSIATALRMGARAAARSLWLAPVGMALRLASFLFTLPAALFLAAVATRGALDAPLFPLGLGGAAEGALVALTAPRTVFVALGLALAGALLGAASRVSYLAGAVSEVGRALAGSPTPAFAAGVAWRFPRVLGAALLALAAELTAFIMGLTALVGVWALARPASRSAFALVTGAGAGAGAIVAALAAGALASCLSDAAVARAALRDAGAVEAVGRAAIRIARRPAAYLLASGLPALAGVAVAVSLSALTGIVLAPIPATEPLLALGPRLMGSAAAALAASLLELWRLGAVAALSCSGPD